MADAEAASSEQQTARYTDRTAWARSLAAPVRDFLSTETGSASVLVMGAIAALVWANSPAWHSYESVWHTNLSIQLGGGSVSTDLRHWVNEGLMTFFFLVVGLEAKRELDLGELRERRRIAIPALAAIGGMAAPIAIYLAFNAGGPGSRGWAAAMSTDTALALGALALLTPRAATRLRVFLLTVAVFDDLAALIVIAIAYTQNISYAALAVAVALFGVIYTLRYLPFMWRRPILIIAGGALWVAMFKSGVDPVVSGLAVGLLLPDYTPSRETLEQATALTRSFREQPTPELARSAQVGLRSAISINERLQYVLHPWTSYVIVPLFALANVGVHFTGGLFEDSLTSPITLGILFGYIVGKPVGILTASWIASRPRLGGLRPIISWPVLTGGATVAGIGFTVSLLVSSLTFHGEQLDQAKLGALGSVIFATLLASIVFAVVKRLPSRIRARQIGATPEDILDLSDEVDPERDHVRGPDDALVTLVEYGDFECPYCGQAESVVRELVASFGDDIRYVWRHLPLNDVHTNAQLAAEASEAAAAQGKFWEIYDKLLSHQDDLEPKDISRYARELDLDMDRFLDEMHDHEYAPRIAEDVSSADASGVSGTPTFFINGRRHYGAYDIDTLTTAAGAARQRARALATASQAS
jgi:Na+/H+ antiporter NhaA